LETQCAHILNTAKDATFGIIVKTNNPTKARAAFYRTRKLLGDVELDPLHIRVSPDDSEGELWIIRRSEAPSFDLGTVVEDQLHA
jgi:hypothetical protein